MAVPVRLSESALSDLESIRAWYVEQGVPDVGGRIVGEILARIERLAKHPELGRVVPEFGQAFLKELIQSPYRRVYRRDADAVRVVRIWRGERRLRLP